MKLVWIVLCSFTLLLSEGMHQKLVISTDKNIKNAQESLLKLQVYFIENPSLRAINESNDLNFELETLGVYTVVVVKPILSPSLKNSLLMELVPVFPDVFALEDRSMYQADKSRSAKNPNETSNSVAIYLKTIGIEWIALLLLATVGLSLSILRRKKFLSLDEKQKELDDDQKEIEIQIKNLGKYNV
jgi:hypothetical protein